MLPGKCKLGISDRGRFENFNCNTFSVEEGIATAVAVTIYKIVFILFH